MNKFQKMIAVAGATAVIGVGGFVSTTAQAATNDQITDYLTSSVATQLGLTDSTTLRQIIADAIANGLIDQSVLDSAANAIDNPVEPPVVDPGTPLVDDDDSDMDDDATEIDDDAEEEDVDDDGDHTPNVTFTNTNDPQGSGVGHDDHGDGFGLGHDHHDDDND